MQTLEYLDPMKASTIINSSQMYWQIAIDLVLHEENKENERILATICTNTSTKAMRRSLL